MPEKTQILDPPVNLSPKNTSATPINITSTSAKKRVRTGCLNCRRKHKKCDETKPVCKTCQIKNEQCEWPTPKLKKSSSRRSSQSHPSIPILNPNITTIQPAAANSQQNYPIYSRAIPSQPVIHHNQLKRPRIEGTSPLEQHSIVPPPPPPSSAKASTTFPPPPPTHHLSQYAQAYEPQQPRRISADLSSYALGKAMPQYLPQQQQQQQPQENYLDQQRPSNGGPGKLNLNSLLNTHYEPPIAKRISIDSSETQFSNSSISSSKNGGELTPISSISGASTSKPSPAFDVPTYKALNSSLCHFFKTHNLQKFAPDLSQLQDVESEIEEVAMIKTYLTHISPRLDILDSQFIKLGIPQLAKESTSVKYALYACSLFQNKSYELGMKLYAKALGELPSASWLEKSIAGTLLTLVSTMVLEPAEWRGVVRDLVLFMDNGLKTGKMELVLECYWWGVLTDINGLDIGEDTTINTEVVPHRTFLYSDVVRFFGMVVNLISMDFADFDQRWESLWNEVHLWYESRSKNLDSVLEFETPSTLFPVVVYGDGSSALANQLYHTVVILLVQNKPRLYKLGRSKNVRPITWHAKQIIGIMLNNESLQSWSNSNQCLWIAGKLLTHQDEHKIIVNLINDIELKTGCCFKYKDMDLKNYWDGKTDL